MDDARSEESGSRQSAWQTEVCMPEKFPSRRDVLKAMGSAALAGYAGFATGLGSHGAQTRPEAATLVDTHLHIVGSKLPRPSTSSPSIFDLLQRPGGAEQLGKMTSKELRGAGVGQALCMPSATISDDDPLGIQPTLSQISKIDGAKLYAVGIAHPERFDAGHLERVEA